MIEVAQVGRQLSTRLLRRYPECAPYLNPDVVFAGCIAHDLGHPCFGHVAEHELDRLARAAGLEDGFEGNAQSFRIVTRLAISRPGRPGLNLTRATLNAVLKYPWFRSPNKNLDRHRKWNAYRTEEEFFKFAREGLADLHAKTFEAQIMDWADDIAYSIHDLLDFYKAGLIPLSSIANDSDQRKRFVRRAGQRAERRGRPINKTAFEQALDFMVDANFRNLRSPDGARTDREAEERLALKLMRRFVTKVEVSSEHSHPKLVVPDAIRDEVEVLKEFTWQYVIDGPPLVALQRGQKEIVTKLFTIYCESLKNDQIEILPPYAREWMEQLHEEEKDTEAEKTRLAVDIVSGMSEAQALFNYRLFTGNQLSLPPYPST